MGGAAVAQASVGAEGDVDVVNVGVGVVVRKRVVSDVVPDGTLVVVWCVGCG